MSWVVSLVGRGGPAVSQDGHETRRHRVRGALFASVFASVLLAACGGGGGGNLTTSSEPEPGPPETGPLTATGGGGDGQGSESENEQQQQIIIVNQEEEQEENNNEEQQQITVNVQSEPEEESESEEEEEQQRQLTIIEEEDFPYVPPEEEEPRYSAATQTTNGLNIGEAITDKDRVTTSLGYTESLSFPAGLTGGGGFPYGLEASERFSDNKIRFLTLSGFLHPKYRGHYTPHKTQNLNVEYKREDGFKGIYIYEGETGELTGDVDLALQFRNDNLGGEVLVYGNISTDLEIEGYDFKGIGIQLGKLHPTTGIGGLDPTRTASKFSFGHYDEQDGFLTPSVAGQNFNNLGQGKIRMVLSPDGRHAQGSTPESYPSYVAGEVEINGFKINSGDGDNNTMVGVFIGDKQEQ